MPAYRKILALIILLVVIGGSVARSYGIYKQEIYELQEWLGGDKLTHIIMGFTILLALRLLLPKVKLFYLFIFVVCLLLLDEFSQKFQMTRNFSYQDFAANFLGAVLAYLSLKLLPYLNAYWKERSLRNDR